MNPDETNDTTTESANRRLRGVANALRETVDELVAATQTAPGHPEQYAVPRDLRDAMAAQETPEAAACAALAWALRTVPATEGSGVEVAGHRIERLPEPEPEWPTAAIVWQDGKVWMRCRNGGYLCPGDIWTPDHLTSPKSATGARAFAREAVPVTPVPTAEWEAWRKAAGRREWNRTEAELIHTTDALGR